nr:protein PHOSPHATE STARVATION RESPONSE 3-like isoform X1 [Ipomoea batatas]
MQEIKPSIYIVLHTLIIDKNLYMMSTPRRNESMNENNGQEVKQAFSGVRKPRFKWTLQVHQRFVDAVNQLGGRYKATPKNIMTLMDIEQITTDHIKSHLQKYRHNGPKQANTNTRKSKKCCFHEFFCTFVYHWLHTLCLAVNFASRSIQVMSDVPEISTERHRTSQTKLEQFERTQQQVKYIEREYQGTPEQSSKNNEERQYPQKRFYDAPLEIISLQMEKGRTSSGFSADETLHERGKCYQVYASPASAAQIEGQNMVAEDNNKTKMSNFPSYKDLKAMNASNEKSFDLNMPAKEQQE